MCGTSAYGKPSPIEMSTSPGRRLGEVERLAQEAAHRVVGGVLGEDVREHRRVDDRLDRLDVAADGLRDELRKLEPAMRGSPVRVGPPEQRDVGAVDLGRARRCRGCP